MGKWKGEKGAGCASRIFLFYAAEGGERTKRAIKKESSPAGTCASSPFTLSIRHSDA